MRGQSKAFLKSLRKKYRLGEFRKKSRTRRAQRRAKPIRAVVGRKKLLGFF